MKKLFLVCFCGVLFLHPRTLYPNESTNLGCGVNVVFCSPEAVGIGSNATWTVAVSNASSTNWTCELYLDVAAIGYDGSFWTNFSSVAITNAMASGDTSGLSTTIECGEYADWTEATLRALSAVKVQGTNEQWLTVTRTELTTPTNILFFSPEGPIALGGCVTAIVSYANPYPFDLRGVRVKLTADPFLSTNGSIVQHEFFMESVLTNESVIVSTNFFGGQSGTGCVWAIITATNLPSMRASREITISE